MDPFALMFDARRRQALAMAQRIVGNRAEAEEIVQDAFFEVWRRAGDRNLPLDPSWVTTTVRCRAIDRVRRRRTAAATRKALSADAVASGVALRDDGFEKAEQRADDDVVRAALRDLTRAQQEAIRAVYADGLTHAEAAMRLDVPLGTLKTRIRLAIARLASAVGSGSRLDAREHDPEDRFSIVGPHLETPSMRENDAAGNGERDPGSERSGRGERLESKLPLGVGQQD